MTRNPTSLRFKILILAMSCLTFLTGPASQAGIRSCLETVAKNSWERTFSRLNPTEQFRNQVILALNLEGEKRFVLEERQPAFRKVLNLEAAKIIAVNILFYKSLGVPAYLPLSSALKIAVSHLSDEVLFDMILKGDRLTTNEISHSLKYYTHKMVVLHFATRVFGAGLMTLALSTNASSLFNGAHLIYDAVKIRFISQQDLREAQKKYFSEESVRTQALQRWKESFQIEKGRSPDPIKYPEDKEEWDFQHNLVRNTPISNLMKLY